MRTKKAVMNIVTTVLLQFVTALFGLILPRFFILTYGSDANGLISSITQFLSYISLLEGGIGGIVVASLYRPLLSGKKNKVMSVIRSAKQIYRRIGMVFILYIAVLVLFLPKIVDTQFSSLYVITMILILSIGTLFQYFFSLAYINLLSANQTIWISNLLNIIMLTANFVVSYVLIRLGSSLHVVKLGSSIVFLAKPIFFTIYVNRKFGKVDTDAPPMRLKQVWNGFAHHVSYFVLHNTDIVVITLFLGVKEVSVYAVYFAVLSGMERMVTSVSTGVAAGIGSIIAENDNEKLNRVIDEFEITQHALTTIMFTVTCIMIIPFMQVYVGDVIDVNYVRPAFAYVMVLAFFANSIGRIYSTITLNAGHYKETQNGAFGQALLNIMISIACVYQYGIVGVAIGTAVSMTFRCIYDVMYLRNNIAKRSIVLFAKNILASCISAFICIYLSSLFIRSTFTSWTQWVGYSFLVAFMAVIISISVFSIVNKKAMLRVYDRLKRKINQVSK